MGRSRKQNKKSCRVWCWCSIVVAFLAMPFSAAGETVKLPMTVDFALLRSLIVRQAYPERDERAAIVMTSPGCNEIWLSNPQLAEENGEVRFQTDIHIIWGTPLAGNCVVPIRWSGTIVFLQQPQIDSNWKLRFVTRNSVLFDRAGAKAGIPGLIWDLVKKNVHGYIESIAIDLAPPVDNLKKFMQPESTSQEPSAAERFLASIRPEQPLVKKYGLAINILADSDVPLTRAEDELGVPPVEDPEMAERVLGMWRSWDALLVNMIGQLSAKELTVQDHQLLLDILLTMRYEFSEVIGGPGLTTNFVRRQFITSWLALKPLFERHLTPRTADSMLGYLSFFTAADALVVMDRIGPMLGIDISREGFYRLANMLSDQPLDESGAVNARLRDMLGLGMPLDVPPAEVPSVDMPPAEFAPEEVAPADMPEFEAAPPAVEQFALPPNVEAPPVDSPPVETPSPESDPFDTVPDKSPLPVPETKQKGTTPFVPLPNEELLDDTDNGAFNWNGWQKMFGPRDACAASNPQLDVVSAWTAELTPAGQLLPRVRKVIKKTAKGLEDKLDATVNEKGWGQRLLEATAWQESCFRQFVVKNKKITYLLSYNNTSVGVMQVNEKVWRGIYDLKELRWNTEYNIMAGSEILALYLNRYIAEHKNFVRHSDEEGKHHLASWLYALYNGGPGQLKKFNQRSASGKLYKTDLSFQDKFRQVTAGDWTSKVDCLPRS